MVDNPYINKQNWGRDLLDRLNNFSDDDGSFNVWTQLPTTGKDGQLLNESHKGYTGILKGSTTTIQSWDGSKWVVDLKIPFSSVGDINQTTSVLSSVADEAIVIYPSHQKDIVLLVSILSGTISFSAYNSKTGELSWSASRTFPAGLTYFTWWTAKATSTATHLYIAVDARTSASDMLTNPRAILYCYSFNGAFVWESTVDTSQYTNLSTVYPCSTGEILVTLGGYTNNKRYVIVNQTNGTITRSSYLLGLGNDAFNDDICLSDFIVTFFGNFIYAISYNLVLANTLNVGSVPSQGVQLSGNTCLLLLNGNLVSYNADTNLTTTIQSLLASEKLVAFNPTTNSIQSLLGEELLTRTLNAGIYPEVGTRSFIFGLGSPTVNRLVTRGQFINPIRAERVTVNYGSGLKVQCRMSFGGQQQQINLQNSIVTQSSINANNGLFNVLSLYAQRSLLDKVTAAEITTNAVTNSSSRIRPENGLRIDNYCHLFGTLASTVGGSSNYTGSNNAMSYTCGVLVNAEYINKDFVSVRGTTDGGSPGYFVALFDPSATKFFLQVAPAIARDLKISNFPNGSGLVVNSSNNFGIGTESPTQKFQVIGTLQATTVMNSGGVITSDPRLKTNMVSLPGSDLWEVCQALNPISFLYRSDLEIKIQEIKKDENNQDEINVVSQKWPLPQSIQYGYNATEVEQLFPELISEDSQGIKYLNSGALFPIFQSAAVAKINSLEAKIESLESAIASLITRIEVLENA